MTFEQASNLPRSEKISLVTCEAVKPSKIFQLYSGNTYSKQVPYFVSDVKQNGVELEVATDKDSLTSGTWFFDAKNKTVYVNIIGDDDPKTTDLAIVYKFFFSNVPIVLPFDLSNGEPVEWLPLIRGIGSIGQQLDDSNVGIVLESQSSVEFINDGFFDSIYDSLIWENQNINFYSFFNGIPLSECKKIFEGVIESKDFSPNKVGFKVKDFVFKLRNQVNLGLFSESDGELLDSIIGTPKRRIYGQVKQAKTIPIDCTKDGYPLTGTLSFTAASKTITGTSTLFLAELNQGDEIAVIVSGEEFKLSVDFITSNTSLTISKESDFSNSSLTAIVKPARPYRFKNRRWHIAGHKLRESEAVINTVINSRQFIVDDNTEFFTGDVITVTTSYGSTTTQVTRKSGDQIVLEQSIFPTPASGDTIKKEPITAVWFNDKELLLNRDFSLTNFTEAILEINPLAEFNIGTEIVTDHNLKFSLNSRLITSNSSSDLRTIVSPGDWIRSSVQTSDTWFEVLHVNAQEIYIKTPYSLANSNHPARIKKVNVIDDDSLITVDCYGYDNNVWVKTASDCVKHLVQYDAGFSSLNLDSFNQAKSDCPYTVSMVIPANVGDESPQIRDVISQINDSVLGSLYGNSTQELCYSIVNTRRPTTLQSIKDDDIISWDTNSNQNIINQVKVNYAPFTDKITGEDGFQVITYTNDFVDRNIKIRNTKEITCFLFNSEEATRIAQRIAFYYSLSQSVITINAKANFFTSSVNDRVYIEFDRLYSRYGESSKRKIGVISGIKKSAYSSEVTMNDLGNIFNRCHTIAPHGTSIFTDATEDEKIKYGFILDSLTLTPDPTSEEDLGSHLIG